MFRVGIIPNGIYKVVGIDLWVYIPLKKVNGKSCSYLKKMFETRHPNKYHKIIGIYSTIILKYLEKVVFSSTIYQNIFIDENGILELQVNKF